MGSRYCCDPILFLEAPLTKSAFSNALEMERRSATCSFALKTMAVPVATRMLADHAAGMAPRMIVGLVLCFGRCARARRGGGFLDTILDIIWTIMIVCPE